MKLPYKINTTVKLTSPYGYRIDPFGSGRKVYHSGIDFVGEDKNICGERCIVSTATDQE